MPQYRILDTSRTDSLLLTDGGSTFRAQVRGDELFFDQEITVAGFNGVEGTDWDNIDSSALPGSNEEEFRLGVRSEYFVTDQAITQVGFPGVENTDWENIEEHQLTTTTSTTTTTTTTTTVP